MCAGLFLFNLATQTCFPETSKSPVLRLPVTVTSPLVHSNVPMDPVIDFGAVIRKLNTLNVLDPSSIEVVNLATGQRQQHACGSGFSYGDKGRIEWVIENPAHREYEIRFRVIRKRPSLQTTTRTPLIGNGDLLRYNADGPRSIALFYAAGLVDLNGDQRPDLVGCWNYAYRPGEPWDGIICYPRRGAAKEFLFGELTQLRFIDPGETSNPQHFRHTYMAADFADFNQDGLVDLIWTRSGSGKAQFFLNTGKNDAIDMPNFTASNTVSVSGWKACRAVDLNSDGNLDLVVDGQFLRNINPNGWPFKSDQSVKLDAGREPFFHDVDRDGSLDAVCLQGGVTPQPNGYRIAWRKNLGGDPPMFGQEQLIEGINLDWCTLVASVKDHREAALLVQHDVYQNLSLFTQVNLPDQKPRFKLLQRAQSQSAVISLSDQAWPCLCDWDTDGDLDLLVGGGYGWPRIVINEGTQKHPVFAEPRRIIADGKPIRLLRNEILGQPHNSHDMGYPYPDFVDWDGDGLKDLMLPNESNRLFWFRNVGDPQQPKFGKRRQVICDNFPDSPELRQQSAQRANDPESNNGVYPREEDQPFMWRTGAAFADWNGDGLMDFVTHDGTTRKATLFTQYRHSNGDLGLRKDRVLHLNNGQQIDDRIVLRRSHWTESFRAVDWDGDGRIDLVYSLAGSHNGILEGGSIYLLMNCGTQAEPVFEEPQTMRCFGEPIRITNHGPHPWVGDFDGDNQPDLICCVEWSVYPFYRYAALMMQQRPVFTLGQVLPMQN